MATKKNVKIGDKEYFRIRRTIDGKVKSFYGSSKGDAEKRYREYLEELARQKVEKNESVSFATIHERVNEYIENALSVSQKYANGTKKRYASAYNAHIKGTNFDGLVASEVRASDIQMLYNGMNVSQQTLRQVHKFMSAFWKWMVLNEYASNVISAVEMPIKTDNSRHDGIQIWEDDEIRLILDNTDAPASLSPPFRACFMVKVLFYTGMRIGEALSLRYSDIEDDRIHIQRQIYLGEIKPPKYNSARTVPLHHDLVDALEKHREWHKTEMRRNRYRTDYVFTTSKGTLYGVENIRRMLNRFYDRIGVPHKNIHTYRSTFCTQLCRCDVPLEVASKLLGHKSLEVTAKHYQLIKNDTLEDAIQKLTYDH